jgi:hypothetical protein
MRRSKFVSVVSWVFIVISGLGTLVAVLQNVIIESLGAQMGLVFQAGLAPNSSWLTLLVVSHLKIYFAILLALAVLALVSSIGLLKRKNWARFVFVGLMVFGIIWNLPSLFSSLAAPRASLLFELGLILILGWIAQRLLSSAVATEFAGGR